MPPQYSLPCDAKLVGEVALPQAGSEGFFSVYSDLEPLNSEISVNPVQGLDTPATAVI